MLANYIENKISISFNSPSTRIQNMSKEEFINLCSNFYDNTIKKTVHNDAYVSTYNTFRNTYKNIPIAAVDKIRPSADRLGRLIETLIYEDAEVDYTVRNKILSDILTCIGDSYSVITDTLNDTDFNDYIKRNLNDKITALINDSKFSDNSNKSVIIEKLTNIATAIITTYKGNICIDSSDLEEIATYLFNQFVSTETSIEEGLA